MSNHNRRHFLSTSFATASILGFGELGILAELAPANEKETRLVPDDVRLTADIAPLVRLIEEAPQGTIVELMVDQLRKGMTYRQFLAATFLAAARIDTSPHHVYVVYAVHQLSQELPYQDRLLPLFWAVAALKWGPAEGPRYPAMDLSKLPSVASAAADFGQAMGYRDIEKAELSLLALCRLEGPKTAFGRLWVYGSRNSNNIGHPAIAFVQAWRTLETIGWRHAESLVQFVVQELATRNPPPLYQVNRRERSTQVHTLPLDWAGRRTDEAATVELLSLLHAGDASAACAWAFESLKSGRVQAQAVWDAVFLGAGELMMRFHSSSQLLARPLHTTTSMNALHYAYRSCGDPATRLLTLLMAVDWTAGFIATEIKRGKL
jgi:hypothetical protein